MRLEEIDVRGFGRLRDVVIPLHPRVTVILGENESGKSTFHRIIRAALYGLDAGGQGRAVERSEWTRWAPWTAGPYGFAVTLSQDSGRRIRIAARLDSREQHVQVFEIGGGDITPEMRSGRLVTPGTHLLGIDEAVFAATAWLGDDGLRLGAPDTAAQRVQSLQEAVERLADSGHATTTAGAILRLRAAIERVGSERRGQSPLGVATARLRHLESDIEAARRRVALYAADQERLRELEARAEAGHNHQLACERAWLVGRLAALGAERIELQRTAAEMAELNTTLEATAAAADFPADDEPLVQALVGEWRHARSVALALEARWGAAAETLDSTRKRLAEIEMGIAALGEVVELDAGAAQERVTLGADLDAAEAELRRLGDTAGLEARTDALRREIAATGLGSIRLGTVDSIAPLLDSARGLHRSRLPRVMASLTAMAAVAAAVGFALIHRTDLGGISAIAGFAVAAMMLLAGRLRGGGSAHARRQLGRLCPELDLSDEGLARAAERLPALSALHDDLGHQEARAATQREEIAAAGERIATVATWIDRLATDLGITRIATDDDETSPSQRARAVLARIDAVSEAVARRNELLNEDAALSQTESALTLLADEAEQGRATVVAIESRLRGRLGPIGGMESDIESLVSAFATACSMRRQHDLASAQLASLRPRLAAPDADAHLAELATRLSRDLISRGGDPADAATAMPLNEAELDHLEREVDVARRRADATAMQAAELRSRLAAAFDGLPALTDLEDERSICEAARDRAIAQRTALLRAIDLLEVSTRNVHRDLAPRLADSISSRLAELTDGRYEAVNVDTDHFAISLLGRERPDLIPLDQVSHGTRDQVGLLLRLALAEVLSDSGESMPLFLDEPLLSADPQRRGITLDFLCSLSEQHQVMLTTSDPAVADAVASRLGNAASVAALAPLTPTLSVDGVSVAIPSRHRAKR